jgi:putative SOS response-associated peptidase YedK
MLPGSFDRVPVILAEEDWAKWLGEEPTTRDELKAQLVSHKDDVLTHIAGQQTEDWRCNKDREVT